MVRPSDYSMMPRMLRIAHKLKIFRPIVQFVAILMMNVFVASQLPAEKLLHNKSVLFYPFPSGFAENTIPMSINPTCAIWGAFHPTSIAKFEPAAIMLVAPFFTASRFIASRDSASLSIMPFLEGGGWIPMSPHSEIVNTAQTRFLGINSALAVRNGACCHAPIIPEIEPTFKGFSEETWQSH